MHPLGVYKVQMWTCEGTAKGCTFLSESVECTGCAGWGVWGLLVVLSVLAVRWSFHLAGCKNACFCVCVSGLEFLWWRKQVLAQRPRWSLLAISFPYSCSKIRTVNLPHCLIHQPPHPHQHTHIPITHTHTYTAHSSLELQHCDCKAFEHRERWAERKTRRDESRCLLLTIGTLVVLSCSRLKRLRSTRVCNFLPPACLTGSL